MKTVHITTVHQRFDSRIFYKECISLQKQFGNVTLIVADGKGNQNVQGIDIIDVGYEKSRIKRMIVCARRAVKKAISLNADIYHFHDSELLLFALKLRKYGKVIFDSHEDFPKLMLQRPYLPKIFGKILFRVATFIEKNVYKRISGVVAATQNIGKKFTDYGENNVVTVRNYPVIDFEKINEDNVKDNPVFTACYTGGLTAIRGVKEMILACEKADTRLILAGPFDDEAYFNDMKKLSGWENVDYLGMLPHGKLKQRVYDKADIGLNMLLSAPNHTDSIPIKQLEYMAHGLPVVATRHIKFCVEVTDMTDCGILVTPENTEECAEVIKFLKENKQKRIEMGKNGKRAVQSKYNWNKEQENLIDLYMKLC